MREHPNPSGGDLRLSVHGHIEVKMKLPFSHFALLLAAFVMVPSGVSFADAAVSPGVPSPVQVQTEPAAPLPFGTQLSLHPGAYTLLAARQSVELRAFPLSQTERVDLSLDRFEVFAENAQLVEMTADGPVALSRPELALFHGVVAGEPGSSVFLSFAPERVDGVITRAGRSFVVSSGPAGQTLPPVVYDLAEVPEEFIASGFECAIDQIPQPLVRLADAQRKGAANRGDAPCRRADVAVETDVEYRQLLGGSAPATAYIGTLLGAVSEIYERDVNTRLQVVYSRIWSGAPGTDPWNQGDTVNQLYQFQDYWNANMTNISRHVAHFLSGRGLGGGVAYLPGLCQDEYDYGLSANLNGFFPYPIQNNSAQNWDLMVTAHELGHNFGAPHTHDLSPPVDGCAWGDCSVAPNGTIMSYCHLCSGGLANVRMEFHQRNIDENMLPYLANDAPCNTELTPLSIIDQPDSAAVCAGEDVFMTVTVSGSGPISYQWRKNTVNIPGANTNVYYVFDVGPSNVGNYDVVCAGPCGSVTSDAAVISLASSYAGDLDGDCDVDLADLSGLLSSYGLCEGAPAYNPAADLDGDGCVGLADLSELLQDFGAGA
ncbi:MAG: hypothetical protein HRF50_08610 [Phycisphaerae bacterium]|jgi:hypothetical protein